MEKFYSLRIPMGIEGINTTLDIGKIGTVHTTFDCGLDKQAFYRLLGNSDLSGTIVKFLVPSIDEFKAECKLSNDSWNNTEVTPIEVDGISSFMATLSELVTDTEKRYEYLKEVNCKNFQIYNAQSEKSEEMRPVIICIMDFDRIAKSMDFDDMKLIIELIKLGRATGVTLLLHSSEKYAIRESISSDVYANLISVDISVGDEQLKETIISTPGEDCRVSVNRR